MKTYEIKIVVEIDDAEMVENVARATEWSPSPMEPLTTEQCLGAIFDPRDNPAGLRILSCHVATSPAA